ncbi:MAG: phage adaptor protein [Solirubrobacteraceae bacterium]
MNLGQLQQSVQDLGYGTDTAAQQIGFLNATYREIHRARRWPFLEAIDNSQSTVAGTAAYTLPMANWRNIDAVRLVWTPNQQQNVPLEYKDPQSFFDLLHVDPNTATPRYWTMYASEVWFYPTPDQAYQVKYYYIQEPADMAISSDVPLVPLPYQDALVSGAICRSAFRQRDWIGLELWTAKYNKDMQDLEEEYLIRQRQTSSEVKRSGYWNTEINYPFSSTGF